MSSTVLEEQDLIAMISLLSEGKMDELAAAAESLASQATTELETILAEVLLAWANKDDIKAVELLYTLSRDNIVPQDHFCKKILLPDWVLSQLKIPLRHNPAYKSIFQNFRGNLRALKKVDPELAANIDKAAMPPDIMLVYTWDGLTGFDVTNKILLVLSNEELNVLDPVCDERDSVGFAGVKRAAPVFYCLERQHEGFLGMTRSHYVLEDDISILRYFFCLYDFAKYIPTRELLIFGGEGWDEHLLNFARDGYYMLPRSLVLDTDGRYDAKIKEINCKIMEFHNSAKEKVFSYYRSDEFKQRQRKIVRGELKPRVLFVTCRWTTFLKYAAKDFQIAFENNGCQTSYVIETDDVQNLSTISYFNELINFKPDVLFAVSHARPSYSFLPKELPFISDIQDRCGKLNEIMDIKDYYSPQDLYVCISPAYAKYISGKNVPDSQILIWPMPAPGTLFYPLPEDQVVNQRYISDVSFVKHCNGWHMDVMDTFLKKLRESSKSVETSNALAMFFDDIHGLYAKAGTKRIYEDDIVESAVKSFAVNSEVDVDKMHFLRYYCHMYYVSPFSDMWRGQFIEALANAGLDLALYGNGWDKYPALSRFARGGVNREKELNYVYNHSKVNLMISQVATLHVRIAECGMANAFIIIADHSPDKDWGPAREYYQEGKEVVFFDDCNDLIDKVRYYTEHEQERKDIADNLRKKVLATMSCDSVVKMILEKWQELLVAVGGENA